MTQLRIMLDLIFDVADKPKVLAYWNMLKNDRMLFKEILLTEEKSTITIHECHHDEEPPLPCVVKKRIVLDIIEQDDVV